jgi:multidrug efflux pump subunit AcrA (membrane-fusion protein)
VQASAAENDLNEASSQLNLLRSGNRPEEIEATRAEISRLHGHRQYLREQLSLLDVLSPASGIVATPSRQLKEKRNELVRKGDLILKIYDFKTVIAQILVSEKDIDGIHIGQRVVARARAFPYREFDGRVASIATSAQSPGGSAEQTLTSAVVSDPNTTNKTILVATELVNSDLLLKSEMTGVAKISCGQKRVIDLIKRRIARTFKVELWSWW